MAKQRYTYAKSWKQMQANRYRSNMTPSERRIALYIARRKGKFPFQFQAQRQILAYIADFYCHPVVVEIDGKSHDGQYEYDARRDAAMQSAGFIVHRVQSWRVFKDLDNVLREIESLCEKSGCVRTLTRSQKQSLSPGDPDSNPSGHHQGGFTADPRVAMSGARGRDGTSK